MQFLAFIFEYSVKSKSTFSLLCRLWRICHGQIRYNFHIIFKTDRLPQINVYSDSLMKYLNWQIVLDCDRLCEARLEYKKLNLNIRLLLVSQILDCNAF